MLAVQFFFNYDGPDDFYYQVLSEEEYQEYLDHPDPDPEFIFLPSEEDKAESGMPF